MTDTTAPVEIRPRPRMLVLCGIFSLLALAVVPGVLAADNDDLVPHPALAVLALAVYLLVLVVLPLWMIVVLARRRILLHPDRIVVTAGERTAFEMRRADLTALRPWRRADRGTRLDLVGPDTTGRSRVVRVTSGVYGAVLPTLRALHADVERRPELVPREEDRRLLHDIFEGIEQFPRESRIPGTPRT